MEYTVKRKADTTKQRVKTRRIQRIMNHLPFEEDSYKYRVLVEHYNKLSGEDWFFLDLAIQTITERTLTRLNKTKEVMGKTGKQVAYLYERWQDENERIK